MLHSFLAFAFTFVFLITCGARELSAAIHSYQDSTPLNSGVITGDGAGEITNFEATYDTDLERLFFSATLNKFGTKRNGDPKLWDGFWLILSPGPPPGDPRDFVIFYGDFNDTKQSGGDPSPYPVLQAFVYSGDASNPYATSPNHFLQAFTPGPDGLNVTTASDSRTASFNIDVSTINDGKAGVTDGDFFGATFGDEIGIWFQPVFQDNHPTTEYTGDGVMTLFEWKKASWYDTSDTPKITTSAVPEPTTFAIWSLLATLGIVTGWRRRSRTA